jgi:hypothetical protein
MLRVDQFTESTTAPRKMISTGDLLYGSYRQASLYTHMTDVLHMRVGADALVLHT